MWSRPPFSNAPRPAVRATAWRTARMAVRSVMLQAARRSVRSTARSIALAQLPFVPHFWELPSHGH